MSKECHDPESLNPYFEFCVLYPMFDVIVLDFVWG